jgi:hypothetical protein
MELLHRVLRDIRRGESIDAYATVLVATAVAVLSLLGVTSDSVLSGVTLAVLALLAVSTLVTRGRIEAILPRRSAGDFFMKVGPFSTGLDKDLATSREFLLCGVALVQTVARNHDSIIRCLTAGGSVKVILNKPDSAGARLSLERAAAPVGTYSDAKAIKSTIELLQATARNTAGDLQLRLTTQELVFGGAYVSPGTSRAKIYAFYYRFKVTEYERLRFVLQPDTGDVYDLHRLQLERLWQHSDPYPLLPP